MDLKEISARALVIRELYDKLNLKNGRQTWDTSDYGQAFAGDVGDLLKLLMMKQGLRAPVEQLDQKIEHELADCLWAVLVLADQLGVDLETSFRKTMNELEERIESAL